jgi:hypothetical protein
VTSRIFTSEGSSGKIEVPTGRAALSDRLARSGASEGLSASRTTEDPSEDPKRAQRGCGGAGNGRAPRAAGGRPNRSWLRALARSARSRGAPLGA